MFTRNLALVAFAALFAASSSVAMMQNARPAMADADDHVRNAHHQRIDRHVHKHVAHVKHNNGKHLGWNKNPHNPHSRLASGKPRHDAWRDHR
jgi:hypothetical protein